MSDVQVVVFNNGSLNSQVGMGGEDHPRYHFKSVVGKPNKTGKSLLRNADKKYVGDNAYSQRGVLTLSFPIENRLVTKWEEMERIWQHSYLTLLKVDPTKYPVVVTEPLLNPKASRERIVTMMFDVLGVPDIYVSPQATLAVFAAAITTGIVLDSGYSGTVCTPVVQGYAQPHSVVSSSLGGAEITQYFSLLMANNGKNFGSSAGIYLLRDIKESVGYVAADYDQEMKEFDDAKDVIKQAGVDGNEFDLGRERFQCTEALFNPSLYKPDLLSLQKQLNAAVQKCDKDLRDEMFRNVILTGGNTLFPGFPERLEKEVRDLLMDPSGGGNKRVQSRRMKPIQFIAPEDRLYSVYKGASMLSKLRVFPEKCISKEEYEQHGASLVHTRCP